MAISMVWSLWSCILYFLGSCGYLALDIVGYLAVVDSWTSFVLYIVLASVFVLEAIFYTIDWCQYAFCQKGSQQKNIRQYTVLRFFASIFHNIGSIVYLLAAIFGGNTAQTQQSLLATPQLFALNIAGTGAFLIEAVITFVGWMLLSPAKHKCHCPHGVALWAHVLNVVGGIIYLVSSILPPILTAAYGTTMTQATIYRNYVRPVQVAGDGIYLIDALLYTVLWIQERKERKKVNIDEPIGPQGRNIVFPR